MRCIQNGEKQQKNNYELPAKELKGWPFLIHRFNSGNVLQDLTGQIQYI